MPSVYYYNDHRKFLEDFILKKQGGNSSYSFRLISKKAGFKSPNYVQQVIAGKKNLSDVSAVLLASALKLDERESKYFCLLVERDSATSESAKSSCETQLKQIKGEFTSIAAQGHQFSLISDWFHTVILELFHMIPVPVTAQKIFDVLFSNLEIEQIDNSLELLKHARLIKSSEFGFCLEEKETNIVFKKNHDPVEIRAFHSKNLQAMKDNLAF